MRYYAQYSLRLNDNAQPQEYDMSTGSAILAVLESDALSIEGPILITFLTAVGASNGDKLKLAAAVVQLQASVIASLPNLEATVFQQLASALTVKLQSTIAAAQSAAAPK